MTFQAPPLGSRKLLFRLNFLGLVLLGLVFLLDRRSDPTAVDVQPRQRCLELFDSLWGHLRLPDIEVSEVLKAREFSQTSIGHFGAIQVQIHQVLEPLNVVKPSVGDPGQFQPQRLEVGESGNLLETRIGNLGVTQA